MSAEQVKPRTVLVVDDDGPIRTLCRISLEDAGFRVLEAQDGQEALASVRTDPPDLILLDIMMPGISGWEVTAELLADRSTDQIPIVFITAQSELSNRIRAYELGAHGYLTKPFDPASCAETVAEVLDQIERGDRDAALAETLTALRKEKIKTPKPSPS